MDKVQTGNSEEGKKKKGKKILKNTIVKYVNYILLHFHMMLPEVCLKMNYIHLLSLTHRAK